MPKRNIADLLAEAAKTVEITVWVPNKDRDGNDCAGQDEWKEKALRLFSEVFGKGATAMPPCDGAWLNPHSKVLVREEPIMVFCCVTESQAQNIPMLRQLVTFCEEMGKAMRQGEVALKIGDRFLLINTF